MLTFSYRTFRAVLLEYGFSRSYVRVVAFSSSLHTRIEASGTVILGYELCE